MNTFDEVIEFSSQFRFCKKCNEMKPISEFRKRERKEGCGVRYRCIKCEKESYDNFFYRNDKSNYHRLKKYGLDKDQFLRLVNSQSGKCKICEAKLELGRTTHVDHCYTTGKIRGILCQTCNTKLGWYENNTEKIQDYLDSPKEINYKNYIPSHAFLY